jgi:transposase
MVGRAKQGELLSGAPGPEGVQAINDRCLVRTQEGHRVVLASGVVLAQYELGDRMSEAHAMVHLVEQGWADQNDVARAFGCSARTVRRCQRRFEEGGLAALGRARGYPKDRPRVKSARVRCVTRLKGEGLSNRAIAARLGIGEKAVRKLLRRLGWKAPELVQGVLPLDGAGADPKVSASTAAPDEAPSVAPVEGADPKLSASSTSADLPLAVTLDTDPADRRLDRLLAYLGLLEDAVPLFREGTRVPGAGVLLAIPALERSGLLACAREVYGTLGPAFYGLRTTLVTMVLMALLRIRRPEGLKERPPEDLGRVLGLDRAPEVKTVRRKLTRLAAAGRAVEFGRALAARRVATRGAAVGFLYVDGHVRVYHGARVLPKAHVARMRLSAPATTDYWVNDAAGDPLFVVTADANAALTKMLPPILGEVRGLVGERRVTIVFDRGGWSPKLFLQLVADGFDVLTYRKGRFPRVARRCFRLHTAVVDGREVRYTLADQGLRLLGGRLRLRQVTRLSEDTAHQTAIVTSRRDLAPAEVAFRMFERWRQENFFKYLREEYALDALVDYQVEPADATREVPNPRWQAVDAQLRAARAEIERHLVHYGLEAITNVEALRRTMRGFKIAHARTGQGVWAALQRVVALEARRAKIPSRVPVGQVVEGEVLQLATQRKHLTNVLKAVAYQIESDLVRQVAPHYRRADDEGRTLIQSALAAAADLHVTDAELHVRLAPLSSPHRTRAIVALCEQLSSAAAYFPGSKLRLRFSVGPS